MILPKSASPIYLKKKRQRTINRIREGDCSTWLSVLPTHANQFLMSADEFRDSMLALHCDMGACQPKCQDSVMGVVSLLTLVMPLIVKKVVLSLPDTMSPET